MKNKPALRQAQGPCAKVVELVETPTKKNK